MTEPAEKQDENKVILEELYDHYYNVMELSSDGMFIYLDDEHKVCNKNLADMFGYSRDEWSKLSPYLQHFVSDRSQFSVAQHYVNSRNHFKPERFKFLARHKDGFVFDAEKAIIPISYKSHFMILNLVKKL